MCIYFTTMEDLLGKLTKDHHAERKGRGRGYNQSALVIVDEVGYTPIGREACNLFIRFIAHRYAKAGTGITSGKAFSDWTEFFRSIFLCIPFPFYKINFCGSTVSLSIFSSLSVGGVASTALVTSTVNSMLSRTCCGVIPG